MADREIDALMQQRLPWLARTRRYGQGWAVTGKSGRLALARSQAVVALVMRLLAPRDDD